MNFSLTATASSRSGRIAILARKRIGDPWTQVESIFGEDNAQDFTGDLEADDERRAEAVDDMADEEWGDDAPINMPTA